MIFLFAIYKLFFVTIYSNYRYKIVHKI